MNYDNLTIEVKLYKVWLVETSKLKAQKELLLHKLSGLKAVDTTKESSHNANENAIMENKLAIIEKLGEIDDEILRLSKNIDHIEGILKKLEPKCVQALIDIFVLETSYDNEAKALGFKWASALRRYIEANIRERL